MRGPEVEYLNAMLLELKRIERAIEQEFVPAIGARFDASPKKKALRLASGLKLRKGKVSGAAKNAARKLDRSNKKQHVGTVANATGVQLDLPEKWKPRVLRQWARENAQLMEQASKRFQEKLSKAVADGVARGLDSKQIQALIMRDYVRGPEIAKTKRKLRQIVRDQSAKLQARLTSERHAELGVKQYIWRTSQDERVRSTHVQRHGSKFKSDKPVEPQLRKKGKTVDQLDGHPGEPPNCRCWREPDLSDLLR